MAAFGAAAALLVGTGSVSAAEIGHYNGGLLNIRDLVMPEPGFYGALYNYFYTTDRLKDRHGDKVKSVTINPGERQPATLRVLMVHGIGPHEPGYATRLAESLSRPLPTIGGVCRTLQPPHARTSTPRISSTRDNILHSTAWIPA